MRIVLLLARIKLLLTGRAEYISLIWKRHCIAKLHLLRDKSAVWD
jgi:hypothetical protein